MVAAYFAGRKFSAHFCSQLALLNLPGWSSRRLPTVSELAPEAGLEPATRRLTAGCSTIELLWNPSGQGIYNGPSERQLILPVAHNRDNRAAAVSWLNRANAGALWFTEASTALRLFDAAADLMLLACAVHFEAGRSKISPAFTWGSPEAEWPLTFALV